MGLFDRLRRPSLNEPNVSAGWEEAEWLTWARAEKAIRTLAAP